MGRTKVKVIVCGWGIRGERGGGGVGRDQRWPPAESLHRTAPVGAAREMLLSDGWWGEQRSRLLYMVGRLGAREEEGELEETNTGLQQKASIGQRQLAQLEKCYYQKVCGANKGQGYCIWLGDWG